MVSVRSNDDIYFRRFAASLSLVIDKYGENYPERQKEQLERLLELEDKFRKKVQAHKDGVQVYSNFISYIRDEKRNILGARPYFRERTDVFTDNISEAFKNRDPLPIFPFRINYRFVKFVLDRHSLGKRIENIGKDIYAIRNEILEMNMPLAISRARIFFSRTPKSHISYMEFIDIACEGLMSGLDKYTPPGGEVIARGFRGVAIGRMTGLFINDYSETPLHFHPPDRQKLYHANKMVRHYPDGLDFEDLAKKVTESIAKEGVVATPAELARIMAAASTISADTSVAPTPEMPDPVARFEAPEEHRPDLQFEEAELRMSMAEAIKKLPVLERKFLRLKGIGGEIR